MTRQKLIAAISGAARLCSYSFYTGQEYRMDSGILELPALWLIPPKLAKTEGREEGVKYTR